jgi:beta-N-acetylhexosaminidase
MPSRASSIARLAGRRIMAGFPGTGFDADLRARIKELQVGGLILFKRNLVSPAQIAELCRRAQDCARGCGRPPLLIAIDQEGGDVARLPPPFTRFPGNSAMAGEADAEHFAAVTAAELASVGITTDLAPVLDVAPLDIPSVMARRSFGPDPQRVARLGAAVIAGLQRRGIMAVGKHFPGIGRTTLDSHLDRPALGVAPAELDACDLVPFRAAIDRRVSGIMLAHVVYERLDPEWPASLSERIVKGLLRGRLGYDGIVYTDDLEMGAITRHYPLETAAERVVAADIDLALICHSAEKQARAFERIRRMIESSGEALTRARASAERIRRLQAEYAGKDAGAA